MLLLSSETTNWIKPLFRLHHHRWRLNPLENRHEKQILWLPGPHIELQTKTFVLLRPLLGTDKTESEFVLLISQYLQANHLTLRKPPRPLSVG